MKRTFEELRQEDLRYVLRHIKHAVSLGHTQLTCGIPPHPVTVERLLDMGFSVELDFWNDVMYVDWTEPESKTP